MYPNENQNNSPTPPQVPHPPQAPHVQGQQYPAASEPTQMPAQQSYSQTATGSVNASTPVQTPPTPQTLPQTPFQPFVSMPDDNARQFANQPDQSSSSKRKLFILLTGIIVLVGMLVGSFFWLRSSADAAAVDYRNDTKAYIESNKVISDKFDSESPFDELSSGSATIDSVKAVNTKIDAIEKELTNQLSKKPVLKSTPFAAQLSANYKKSQELEANLSSYVEDAQKQTTDMMTAMKSFMKLTEGAFELSVIKSSTPLTEFSKVADRLNALATETEGFKTGSEIIKTYNKKVASDLRTLATDLNKVVTASRAGNQTAARSASLSFSDNANRIARSFTSDFEAATSDYINSDNYKNSQKKRDAIYKELGIAKD